MSKMKYWPYLDIVLAITVVTLLGIGAFVTFIEAPETALEHVGKDYTYLHVYEDGSYRGETVDGQPTVGCLDGGLCKD